ncbi:MAG: hypothetical protein WCO04_09995 [Pseudomonadota bacterium]
MPHRIQTRHLVDVNRRCNDGTAVLGAILHQSYHLPDGSAFGDAQPVCKANSTCARQGPITKVLADPAPYARRVAGLRS